MRRGFLVAAIGMGLACATQPAEAASAGAAAQTGIVVGGGPGAREDEAMFCGGGGEWGEAAGRAKGGFGLICGAEAGAAADLDRLRDQLSQVSERDRELVWLVMIGHGTYDGQVAKFNLRGVDLAADELAKRLAPIKSPLAVVDCSSASAPFINAL